MVHKTTKADLWYHEFGNELCKGSNAVRIAIKALKKGVPTVEVIEELKSGIPHLDKCHAIIQEVYIDANRQELNAKSKDKEQN